LRQELVLGRFWSAFFRVFLSMFGKESPRRLPLLVRAVGRLGGGVFGVVVVLCVLGRDRKN